MMDELEEAFEDDGTELELVMPFVCCESQGGPYNDHAFVAGTRFQELWQRLQHGKPDVLTSYEFPESVPQLELLAMHFGYVLQHRPWDEHPDEWEECRFVLPQLVEASDE